MIIVGRCDKLFNRCEYMVIDTSNIGFMSVRNEGSVPVITFLSNGHSYTISLHTEYLDEAVRRLVDFIIENWRNDRVVTIKELNEIYNNLVFGKKEVSKK